MPPAVLSWSGGTDATLAERERCGNVERRMTGVNADVDRMSVHGVRRDRLDARTDTAGERVTRERENTDYHDVDLSQR